MNNQLNKSKAYPEFENLKTRAKWAGIIGLLQAIIFIGLSVVGLLYYMCVLENDAESILYGNIVGLTIHRLYFYSKECDIIPLNQQILGQTILNSSHINILTWVYLVLSVFLFATSIALIRHVNIKNLKKTNIVLYIWVFIVLTQSALDLGLGIIFGLDYNKFHSESSKYKFQTTNNVSNVTGTKYLAQELAALSMMIICLKGFLLWLINVEMMIFLFKNTFLINEKQTEQASFIQNDYTSFQHPIHSGSPVTAYDPPSRLPVTAYDTSRNESVQKPHDNRAASPISSLDAAAIERASKLSNAVLMSRKSKFANYEQYPPDNNQNNQNSPIPDYSPNENPFVRRQNTNSFLKNQRYQSYLYNNNNQ